MGRANTDAPPTSRNRQMNSNTYIPLMARLTISTPVPVPKINLKKVAANGTFPELRVYILS